MIDVDNLIYRKQVLKSNEHTDEELMILCSLREIFKDLSDKTFPEYWVKVKGYENNYMVSNHGRLKTLKREIVRKDGKKYFSKEKIMKLNVNDKTGYVMVTLRKDNKNYYTYIHRLVAEHFIKNKDNKPNVNHIDGDKTNNKFWNLEWCNHYENMKHSFKNKLHNFDYRQKPVIQYSLDGKFIAVWSSAREVEKILGFNRATIQDACKSISNKSNGYVWKYIEEKYDDFIEKYAFSYSIGRMTYIVGVFYDYITNRWNYLSESFKLKMLKEINDAERDNHLGMDCDKKYWFELRDRINKEIQLK